MLPWNLNYFLDATDLHQVFNAPIFMMLFQEVNNFAAVITYINQSRCVISQYITQNVAFWNVQMF